MFCIFINKFMFLRFECKYLEKNKNLTFPNKILKPKIDKKKRREEDTIEACQLFKFFV